MKLRKSKFDLIFSVQLSPVFSSIPAIFASRYFKKPLFLWILDLWPDSLRLAEINSEGGLYSIVNFISQKIYKSADLLLISSKGFKDKLLKMSLDANKIIYFPQWVEGLYVNGHVNDEKKEKYVSNLMSKYINKNIFMFAGNIGEAQDFASIVEGISRSSVRHDINFMIIGEGRYKSELEKLIRDYNLHDTVHLLGRYESEFMPFFYNYADFLVLSLSDSPISRLTFPGKMQTYMNAGKPILAMIEGETSQIISESSCGFVADFGDASHFSALLEECCFLNKDDRRLLGENGKRYANENFSLSSLKKRILEIMP